MHLRQGGPPRPLTIAITSGYHYLANDIGLGGKTPTLVPVVDVRAKLAPLLESGGAPCDEKHLKNCANAHRLACMLDVAVDQDDSDATAIIARDWNVCGKPFRATWTMGAFIYTMQLRRAASGDSNAKENQHAASFFVRA